MKKRVNSVSDQKGKKKKKKKRRESEWDLYKWFTFRDDKNCIIKMSDDLQIQRKINFGTPYFRTKRDGGERKKNKK